MKQFLLNYTDLLQLINNKVRVKLLKSSDYIMMDEEAFKKEYGLVTCDLAGNSLAMQLGEEFEDHLKA